MTQTSTPKTLYDRDLNLWLEDPIAKLKARRFEELDLVNLVNLIDEVESLSRRDERELRRRIKVLLSYLVKRCYVSAPEAFRNWSLTIREQRSAWEAILEDSPRLKPYLLNQFEQIWQKALAETQEDYPDINFPSAFPVPTDVGLLLTEKFWN